MKKILLISLLLVALMVGMTQSAKSRFKSYYSGDAINYHNIVVAGSTNSDSLEIFQLGKDGLSKILSLQPFNSRFGTPDNFSDLKFSQEGNRLYVYAISGYTIYKYDISDLQNATLVKKVSNTYWEWYSRVDKFGDDIVTISARGVDVWSSDLDVVDHYDITNEVPYNISSGNSSQYIFNVTKDEIQIYDRTARKFVRNIEVNYHSAYGNRSIYYDQFNDKIYVVDDRSAKKFNFETGALEATFEHSGNPGYDVASSDNNNIYFSNGLGVVKLNKADMKLLTSKETGGIAGDGGWAMGLRVVSNLSGDKVVVFNNSSVMVLNDKLELLGYSRAGDTEKPEVQESLYLKLNTPKASANNTILLTGGGYFPNEKLTIDFKGNKVTTQADAAGRFKQSLSVPGISADVLHTAAVTQGTTTPSGVVERTDIKVVGTDSNLSYSISFEIND